MKSLLRAFLKPIPCLDTNLDLSKRPRKLRSRRTHAARAIQPHFDQLERRTLLTGTLGLAVTADVPNAAHGDTVTYTYEVTFTPSGVPTDPTAADGSSITVSDDRCSPVNPILNGGSNIGDDGDGNIEAGETWQYSCALVVPAHSDSEADPLVNNATVTGNDTAANPATAANDSASVNLVHAAGTLSIVASADLTFVEPEDTLTYSFDVTYASPDGAPATGVTVTPDLCDAPPVLISGDADGDTRLDATETWTFRCVFSVAEHDDNEQDPLLNTAHASGFDFDGDPLATATSNTVAVDRLDDAGTLTIVKSADLSSVSHGGTITYTFGVTFEFGADFTAERNIIVTDPNCSTAPVFAGGDTLDHNGLLDPGETWVYTCTHVVSTSHASGEQDPIEGTARVDGDDLDNDAHSVGVSNSVSVDIIHTPGTLAISQSADASIPHGGTISYAFDVSYTPGPDGSPAQNVTVSGPQCDAAPVFSTGDTNADGLLDGNETWTFVCSHVVPALHNNSEENHIIQTATVSGTDLDGDAVTGGTSNQVSVAITHDIGSLTINKSAGANTVEHGGTIAYAFDVNYAPGPDGSPAQNIVVTDAKCDDSPVFTGGDANADGLLDGSETWSYACTRVIPSIHMTGEEDLIQNTATASGQNLDGTSLPDAMSNTVAVTLSHSGGVLDIVKNADVISIGHGGTIHYSFAVTFTTGTNGNTAHDILVTDAKCDAAPALASGDTDGDSMLDPGETWMYTCSHTVPTLHGASEEPIVNSATVTGQNNVGEQLLSQSNAVSVQVTHDAGVLAISKDANVSSVPHGGSIVYTFQVSYTPGADGSPAQNIVISDSKCNAAPALTGGDDNTNGLLDGGETWIYGCSHTVPALHSAGEEDPIAGSATAAGKDLDGDAVTGATSNSVSVDVTHSAGSLAIVKSANAPSVAHGGSISYTFQVSYTPGIDGSPAQNIAVTDSNCDAAPTLTTGDANSNGLLDGGETWSYTCSHAVPALHSAGEQDPIVSTAAASGQDLDNDAVTGANSNPVSVNVTHDAGALAIVKSASALTVAHGGSITYTLEVSYTPGADGSPAQNVVVTDSKCDAAPALASGDANANGLLDGGETWTYTCAHAVAGLHSAGEEDPIVNSADVSGQDLDGDPVTGATSNSVSVNVTHTAGALSVAKSAGVATIAHGASIGYTIDVTYTPGADGSPAHDIVVTDAKCDAAPALVGGDANANGLLDAGETWSYTCSHAVPALHSSGEEDPITNSATASGNDLDGDAVTGGTSNTVSVDIFHASISGLKFVDVDGNGSRGANEFALPGWTIRLFRDANGNGVFDAGTDTPAGTMVTDSSGSFSFDDVVPGTYFVREDNQANWAQTTINPGAIAITGVETVTGQNFGNRPPQAVLVPDPADPSKMALLVVGTAGNDKISFKATKVAGDVVAKIGKVTLGTFHPTGRIIAYGLAGNDSIALASNMTIAAQLMGGIGNDKLTGAKGNDILLGGDGKDTMNGGLGRDILIGGPAGDKVSGSTGDDIMIGGTTDHDANDAALAALLAEWSSTRDYATRVNNLRGTGVGPRANGSFFLKSGTGATVHDDAIADSLSGGGDLDWYFARTTGTTRDKVSGRKTTEQLDVI